MEEVYGRRRHLGEVGELGKYDGFSGRI